MNYREGPWICGDSRQSCFGCKWHDMQMVRSGLDPEYDHYCQHPDAPHTVAGGVAWIGKSDVTPRWCPFIPMERGTEHATRS